MLPQKAEAVLEVGCGTGATLRWLKDSGFAKHTTGIELFESAALIARNNVDKLYVGDAEKLIAAEFSQESFDLVLCLDVLEHMVDPWTFILRIEKLIKPNGMLIGSIPNVRHLSILVDLVLRGRWTYRSQGILDRTHLRFFTYESANLLMTSAHLRPVNVVHNIGPRSSKSGLVNALTFGTLKSVLATQFIIASRKA